MKLAAAAAPASSYCLGACQTGVAVALCCFEGGHSNTAATTGLLAWLPQGLPSVGCWLHGEDWSTAWQKLEVWGQLLLPSLLLLLLLLLYQLLVLQ
jgi:hypothetical protein